MGSQQQCACVLVLLTESIVWRTHWRVRWLHLFFLQQWHSCLCPDLFLWLAYYRSCKFSCWCCVFLPLYSVKLVLALAHGTFNFVIEWKFPSFRKYSCVTCHELPLLICCRKEMVWHIWMTSLSILWIAILDSYWMRRRNYCDLTIPGRNPFYSFTITYNKNTSEELLFEIITFMQHLHTDTENCFV
jgi:hypothetical protein